MSEVIRLRGETTPDNGFRAVARRIADGDDQISTLQAVAAGCIRRLAEKLEDNPCGASELLPELQSHVRESSPMKLPSGPESDKT